MLDVNQAITRISLAERTLQIRFVLEEDEALSPSDFVHFFAYGEEIARDLAETEALELFDYLGMPSEWQIESLEEFRQLLKHAPAPAEILDIRHESPWYYLLAIPAGTVLFFVSKCVHPEIKRAWAQSAAREHFFEFMRDRVFGGARQKVQQRIAKKPSRKGVRAKKVEELKESRPEMPLFEVRMERSALLHVSISDEELLEEFKRRLRG